MKRIWGSLFLFLIVNGVAHNNDLFESLKDFENKSLTSIGEKIFISSQYQSGYFKGKGCELEVQINSDGSVANITEIGNKNDKEFCQYLSREIKETKIPSYVPLGERDSSRKLTINLEG